jgi:hypothetical protein
MRRLDGRRAQGSALGPCALAHTPGTGGGGVGVVATVVLTLPWGLGGAILASALTQATVAVATVRVSRRVARAPDPRSALP